MPVCDTKEDIQPTIVTIEIFGTLSHHSHLQKHL